MSNNVAEYRGLSVCLRRAVTRLDHANVFQVDSLLVARQMAPHDAWACRSPDLVPLRDECRMLTVARMGHQAHLQGVQPDSRRAG